MFKIINLVTLIIILNSINIYAQQKKGDKEIQLSGYFVYTDYSESASLFIRTGTLVTDNIKLGLQSNVSYSSDFTIVGGGVFANYSFLSSNSKTVPFVGIAYNKSDLDNWDIDSGGLGGEVGFKQFVNSDVSFDVAANYLVTISSDGEFLTDQGIAFLSLGFSFLF